MEKCKPIENDKFGFLCGRNCIIAESITQKKNCLQIKAEIDGMLASKIDKDINILVDICFKGVIAYYECELDTYEAIENTPDCNGREVFWIVEDSQWLDRLPVRKDYDKSSYKHYVLYEYDHVFNVFAKGYEINGL